MLDILLNIPYAEFYAVQVSIQASSVWHASIPTKMCESQFMFSNGTVLSFLYNHFAQVQFRVSRPIPCAYEHLQLVKTFSMNVLPHIQVSDFERDCPSLIGRHHSSFQISQQSLAVMISSLWFGLEICSLNAHVHDVVLKFCCPIQGQQIQIRISHRIVQLQKCWEERIVFPWKFHIHKYNNNALCHHVSMDDQLHWSIVCPQAYLAILSALKRQHSL
jgi:hypothetical protein